MSDRAWRLRFIRSAAATAIVAIALGVPSASAAQAARPAAVVARPGDVIRLRTAQWEYTGRFISVRGDTAIILAASDTARVATPSVRRAQVQRGTRRSAGRIALFSAAGAAAGTLVASIGILCCDDVSSSRPVSGGVSAVTVGAFAGAGGGAVWGAEKRYPRWFDAVLAP